MYLKLQKLIVLLLVLSVLASCGGDKEEEKTEVDESLPAGLQEIQNAGKLVVGTAITRPFEYRDAETNELIGFDVGLMNAIVSDLGVEIEWREMAFADLINELSNGNVDVVIAGMYITDAREEVVDFAQAYLDTGLVMVTQTDAPDIEELADLTGRTVGVKEGATGERWAEELRETEGVEMELRRYTDTLDSLNDLDAGLVDVVLNDRINTLEYIKTHPNIHIQGDVLEPAGVGIAVQSGNADLLQYINDQLDKLKTNGQIDSLFDQWINPETSQ